MSSEEHSESAGTSRSHRVGVIGGDGIGPEVTTEAFKVVDAALGSGVVTCDLLPYSAEHTINTGITIPEGEFDRFRREYDAIFLGALGDPRIPDMRHGRDILLGARIQMDLFINLRPVKLLHPRLCPLKHFDQKPIEFVIFRENTEGLYVGSGANFRKDQPDEFAVSDLIATRAGTERIIRAGYEYCRRNGLTRLCVATKHNAVPHAHGLWNRLFEKIDTEYPEVQGTALYADVAAMELIRDPMRFDVIVSSNLLGDILSDLAAQIVGGLGVAPSANLHPGKTSLYEPVHGSAPDLAGKGLANPLAAIMAARLMVRDLGYDAAADRIETAVASAIAHNETTPDLGGALSTQAAGDAVCARLA